MAIMALDNIKGHRCSDYTEYGQGLDYSSMVPINSDGSNIFYQTYDEGCF